MIIKRLVASFGNLRNNELILKPGLNIIEAPNESGKSTWCAFIRTMLFGINTSDRDKTGYLSDKTRYRPWSGGPMEGSMEVQHKNHDITLQRKALGTAPMKAFSATYSGTNEIVPGLSSENVGELFTGVTERIFERSAFIRQSGIKINQTAELEKRISSLVSTGDETSSYTDADEKLRAWLRKRRYHKSGTLPSLEMSLSETNEKLYRLEQESDKLSEIRQEIERLKNQNRQLQEDIDIHNKLENREVKRRILDAQKKSDAAAVEVAAKKEALTQNGIQPTREDISKAQAELASLSSLRNLLIQLKERKDAAKGEWDAALSKKEQSIFAPCDIHSISERVKNAATEETAKQTTVTPKKHIFQRVFLVLLMAVSATAAVLSSGLMVYISAIISLTSLILLILSVIHKKKNDPILQEYLTKFDVTSVSELADLIKEHEAICASLDAAKRAYLAAEQSVLDTAGMIEKSEAGLVKRLQVFSQTIGAISDVPRELSRISTLLEKLTHAEFELVSFQNVYKALLDSYHGDMDEPDFACFTLPLQNKQDTIRALDLITSRLRDLTNRYNISLGEVRSIGDPLVLGGEKMILTREISDQMVQYDALTMAIDTLKEANTELQTRFSPLLSQKAGLLYEKLTGGRYHKLTFGNDLDASAKSTGDSVSRDVLSLSEGTADQLYLALRLAICELVLPEDHPCPIILDDALTNFDDERAGIALDLLHEMSSKRQIVLFTCQRREASYFFGDTSVNLIKIS